MSRPFAPVLAASLIAVALAGCSGTGTVPPSDSPAPTPFPMPTAVPVPTRSPDSGDVVGTYPELTIEVGEAGELAVTVTDPEARAWRVTAAGTGPRAGDRLEVVVETGDILPSVLVYEYRDGVLVDVVDLTGTLDGTQGAAGGCHGTLPVCISSDGIRFPADGDGTLSVRLELPEASPLSVTGATAGWPGEPFELGPWEQTLPFVWPQG